MQSRNFPKGQGLAFTVDISETSPGVVTVPDFNFELQEERLAVTGGTFELLPGDTLYITPAGLKLMVYDPETKSAPYPSDKFSTGAAYWLVQNVAGEMIRLEVER